MPVNFFPNKDVSRLDTIILNQDGRPNRGEISVYKLLLRDLGKSEEKYFVWHDLNLSHHNLDFNPYKKISAQIDFLIVCQRGILVLEVKGGDISISDGTFFYGNNFDKKMNQDPFQQAEGYKYTLLKGVLSPFSHSLFCHAVAFPDVQFRLNLKLINDAYLWTLFRGESEYNNSIESFIIGVFNEVQSRHQTQGRKYRNLTDHELSVIKDNLSPTIYDHNTLPKSSTLEWLQIENLDILDALYENKRIMIEGPPGSGKTTIAKGYLDRKKGKRGIYICWNNLLMAYTQKMLDKRGLNNSVEVTTLTRLLIKLNNKINYRTVIKFDPEEFSELVYKTMRNNNLPQYDYMVIDEGQDIFNRGIEAVINRLCGYNSKGLTEGDSLILYDIEQAHRSGYQEAFEVSKLLSEHYAHFRLVSIKRQLQAPRIIELSNRLWERGFSLHEGLNDSSLLVTIHKNLKEIKRKLMSEYVLNFKDSTSSLIAGDCVLLIESTIINHVTPDQYDLTTLITVPGFEEMDPSNIGKETHNLQYTSILKFKGLERPNVILVVNQLSFFNQYEIFIGVTRAINHLRIFVYDRN
ncbi:MAG: NERD domain-containing protein [Bacteroidetes bacterium]|nr:NERD domain-containing protein [Bacteroidota bacterium]